MGNAFQLIRSIFFIIQMYIVMALFGLFGIPLSVLNREYAFKTVMNYCKYVRWSAAWMVGLKSEIRGDVPDGDVIVASKHQNFFDILMLVSVLPRPRFIYKKELDYVPIIGYFAKRLNCIAVDRGKKGQAIKKMVRDVNSGKVEPGQLIIFSQGTRVGAGEKKPYKVGTGVLYKETGQAVVPVATNVGVFWKRHGLMRYPGLGVLEFLPKIEQGYDVSQFMTELEAVVEAGSNDLMREAGFDVTHGTD
ncbi:MAG: lysophospholipid acyltransferase family protein [Halocynthiibacter sp.]